jgi:predicted RND superfamily exporter protein
VTQPDRATRVLARLVRYRALVIGLYALLLPIAIVLAMRIPREAGIERLIVPSDPDYAATRAFEALFHEPLMVLLVVESDDPWRPRELARLQRIEAELARVPHVTPLSVIDVLGRARPHADVATLRQLALGAIFFRRQGLVGDRFLTVVVQLDVHDAAERDATLAGIDDVLARAGPPRVHRVGTPYVNAALEHASATASTRAFAVFAALLVAITLFMYRSFRTLIAIVLALGTAVALAVAAGELLGFSFTIVSSLVPLTVMVTTLATLTYLQSRFIDQPDHVSLAEHHVAALRNKLLPVTASTLAAAAGFAALAVSSIRPIRQMGIWTAVGLLLGYVVAYSLFPALQRVLRTPTGRRARARVAAYDRLANRLPGFTYRHRRALVAGALVVCLAGVLALTGVPGLFARMPVQTEGFANLDPSTHVVKDLRWFREHVMDLGVVHLWLHLPHPTVTDPDVLQAIDRLETMLDSANDVTGVAGPTTPLRLRSYLAGHGEALPEQRAAFAAAVDDIEQLLLTEPEMRAFIAPGTLADAQITVLFRHRSGGYTAFAHRIDAAWEAVRTTAPALDGARMHVVGESLLEAKVGENLVPTLAESFVLTIAIILVVFLLVFRSGTERLLAMIPSMFALLTTFLGLRVLGGALNVATIIIATTVLGTTENDQMHLFHHMHERAGAGLELRLRHTLHISGRAIVLATVINAVGFAGLATSSFPPLRQFGLMTASAFVLALVADLTVLPAALWCAAPSDRGAPEREAAAHAVPGSAT